MDDLADNKPLRETIQDLKDMALKCNIPEHEIVSVVSILYHIIHPSEMLPTFSIEMMKLMTRLSGWL